MSNLPDPCPACQQPIIDYFCKHCQVFLKYGESIEKHLGSTVCFDRKSFSNCYESYCVWITNGNRFVYYSWTDKGYETIYIDYFYPDYNTSTDKLLVMIKDHIERMNKIKAFM